MKKAVVIGALGFIGFALCQRLLEVDFEVLGIEQDSEDHEEKSKEQKHLEIARNSNFRLITDQSFDLNHEVQYGNYNVIINCMLPQKVNESNLNAVISDNHKVLTTLMNFCQKTNALYIHLSSYEVFSNDEAEYSENTPRTPRNLIGKLKASEEAEILKFSQSNPTLNYLIIRLPTVYGPWQTDHMTFQQLINGIDQPSTDPIIEDAVFVYDVASMLLKVCERSIPNEIILIGSQKKDQWHNGYNLLVKDVKNKDKAREVEIRLSKLSKKFSDYMTTSIEEGIALQKDHYDYMKRLKSKGLL